ncbi:DEAD/DEAH box helicase [Acidicapsa dinghuensis]|uniref:DEAD/DEAH box helicase n=1 Tax=Acidicapsa dinghuensis TaxID=2218256 RepID=A0ABW1EMW8_9BACT|nr:DEAD/DEAH box helicase [Acidicapsa dinghuensis]
MTQFSDFAISDALKQRIASLNFVTPTPVQASAVPPALEGRDVLATAQTGTGKTLSFLIPIVERFDRPRTQSLAENSSAATKSSKDARRATTLILLPTRELAMQVEAEFLKVSPNSRNTVALVVGGMAEGPQLEKLRRGARVIVATPGRLEDYLDRKLARLDGIEILVLDEVDRMLDMGFQPAIRRIADSLPANRQTLCYSATLDAPIQRIAQDYLKDPVRIEIGSVLKPSENVELQTFEVEQNQKQELLEHLLENANGSFLVFVRTKHGADRVAQRLVRNGHAATQIHGDRTQAQRNQALKSFSEGRHRVLVATDVAARGIDVAHVAHVVNYDIPKVAEDFVHRIGRTGRAKNRGIASTFASAAERSDLRKIERNLGISMKRFRVTAPQNA